MGSCATLWALEAEALQELLERPAPSAPAGVDPALWAEVISGARSDDELSEQLRAEAEVVPVDTVAVATWRDPADNDLSRIAQGEAFDRLPAERAAEVFGRPAILEQHAGQKLYPGFVLDPAERAALEALGGLLGLEPHQPEDVPWWVRARWSEPGCGFWVGIRGPEQVRALRDALRATRLLDKLRAWDTAARPDTFRTETYATLTAFLDRAADGGCGVVGVEGQS